MKQYTVIFIFSRDLKEVLLIKKFHGPYPGKYNGVGGYMKYNENHVLCALRECKEETGREFDVKEMEYMMMLRFPYGVELYIFYSIVDKFTPTECDEGFFVWKPVQFALDFNNQNLAGDGNLSYFVREALRLIKSEK